MKITSEAGTSTIELESYPDLLKIRALPDYRWTGEQTITCDTADLDLIGFASEKVTSTWDLAPHLFDYQDWIVRRALDKERFALFADTGLGKTAMQLEWARQVTAQHGGRTLIIAPLNICPQTIEEARRFYGDGMTIVDLTKRKDLDAWLTGPTPSIGITNFEKFDGSEVELDVDAGNLKYQQGDGWPVDAVCIDESSMLKSFGSRKFAVVRAFDGVRWKLCCSATPAPNQRTEFAQHAVFLGQVRATTEYLTAYFVNRDGDWEFKPHSFEAWCANLASWAVFVRDPKAWGFDDHLSDLPPLEESFPQVPLTDDQLEAARGYETGDQPSLFGATPGGVTSRTKMMQIAHGFELNAGKIAHRYPTHKPAAVAALCNEAHGDEQVIVWVTFDEEGDQLAALIGPHAVHLSGKTNPAERHRIITSFREDAPDAPRVLILKPAMFGFGVNLQSCAVQVFSTITDSFERYYQCVRRSYRFGQTRAVKVYVPLTQLDEAICQNTMNKQSTFISDARALEDAVVARLRPRDTSEAKVTDTEPMTELDRNQGKDWTLIWGDSIAHLPTVPDHTFDLSVFSPPFAALYAYSKALGDMGNVRGDAEFRLQWKWFAEALLPKMKPGRVVAIHCKEIIKFANTSGYRHCYDFPSDLRQGMVDAGFHYQRRITIWKNPQLEATRNKESSLLHVTALRNASASMPQTGEYLMVFTAPGDVETKVTHERDEWSFEHHTAVMNTIWPEPGQFADDELEQWRQWIWPDKPGDESVWTGIRETDVLTAATAKETPEEKHVCPLQLGLIDRCVTLWTNRGELVFSPFAGIGSEGWSSIGLGRRFYGVELKESYFRQASKNLAKREASYGPTLFDKPEEVDAA